MHNFLLSQLFLFGFTFTFTYFYLCLLCIETKIYFQLADYYGQSSIMFVVSDFTCLQSKTKSNSTPNFTEFLSYDVTNLFFRNMQETLQNITDKIDQVKKKLDTINDCSWKNLVVTLFKRQRGYTDDMATSVLNFISVNIFFQI